MIDHPPISLAMWWKQKQPAWNSWLAPKNSITSTFSPILNKLWDFCSVVPVAWSEWPTHLISDVLLPTQPALKLGETSVFFMGLACFFLYNILNSINLFCQSFETQNGINVASIGKLKDSKTFVVSGSYSYTGQCPSFFSAWKKKWKLRKIKLCCYSVLIGANGKKYRVRYTADEFGYHPVTEEDHEPDPMYV